MLYTWKENYDKPRPHIKKQRHYFVDQGPSSQSYGFSSSHVSMWELDHKEGWAPKNWCFWTVVLEMTLESPLDCKETKQSILKEIRTEYSLEGLMLKMKLQYFDYLMLRADPFSQFSLVQSLSRVRLFMTPWIAACQASLSITNSRSSLKLTSIKSVIPSSHLILWRPLFLLPPIPPSIRVFSNESTLPMRWLKYWSFSVSIILSKEIPGLISFRMDWLDLLAVQGTLKSLLQHHSSKASILRHSAFFTVQLSHPYMTIGKTIALTRWTFVGKVMSLFWIGCLGWS